MPCLRHVSLEFLFHQVSLILSDSLSGKEGMEMSVDTWTQGHWIALSNAEASADRFGN